MVGEEGKHFRIDLVFPECMAAFRTEAEEGAIDMRIHPPVGFSGYRCPMVLVLPWVSRQFNAVARYGERFAEINLGPRTERRVGNLAQHLSAVRAARHAGKRCAAFAFAAQYLAQIGLKDIVRADLDQNVDTAVDHCADGVAETHGPAHVVPPVVGVEALARRCRAKDSRIVGNARRRRRHGPDPLQKIFVDGIECTAVKCIVEIEHAKEDLLARQSLSKRDECGLLARQRDRCRCVDRGKFDPAVEFAFDFQRLFWRNAGRRHASMAARTALRFGSGDDQPHSLIEIEGAGEIGGGNFADTVSGDGMGRQPFLLKAAPEPDLQREQRRLRHFGLLHAPIGVFGMQRFDKRPSRALDNQCVDRVQFAPEDIALGVKLAAHAGPLGAVAVEDEADLGKRRAGLA